MNNADDFDPTDANQAIEAHEEACRLAKELAAERERIEKFKALIGDVALLMRVNAPMNDGSPIHKAVVKMLEG